MYRHGDILLAPVAEPVPCTDTWRPCTVESTGELRGKLVLATGEATGHAHVLSGSVEPVTVNTSRPGFPTPPQALVRVYEPSLLTHEEHAPLMVPPGWYEIVRQRVYTPSAPRWVID